jgi:Flp pilus assembly protein TadB
LIREARDLARQSRDREGLHPLNETPEKTPRNPLRNEGDMFRVLIMFGVAAAIVIAVALLISSLAGAIVGVILVAIGLWRTWNLIQDWRRYGSDPAER